MGGEGHINSLFPHTAAVRETDPTGGRRHRLTQAAAASDHVDTARRSALARGLAGGGGAAKADAVAAAVGGADPVDVPAAGAIGREATVWLLDEEAAAILNRRR